MAAESINVLEELDLFARKSNSLEKLINSLKGMKIASNEQILDLVVSVDQHSSLVTEILTLKCADIAAKIISAAIISVISYTPASAAFLSTACYFLVDNVVTILFKATYTTAVQEDALTGSCNAILKSVGGKSFTNLPGLSNNLKAFSRIMRKDLDSQNIFRLSAMAGTFIGANLGTYLGFDWLGKSIANISCSFVSARYAYSFWSVAEPGSSEEYERQFTPRPIL